MKSTLQFIQQNQSTSTNQLIEFLKIPSVSAKSAHKEDCRRAAQYLIQQFNDLNIKAELCETPGHPIVLARHHAGDGKPTVLVYGHYDVQPEEPTELWHSPPFEPTIRDGNLFARGATDDKGQVFTHLKAAEALLKSGDGLNVNVIYLIEGEEEIASRNLEAFIGQNKDKLKADIALISDTSQFSPGQPMICYGLRGIYAVELRVESANSDLHSGSFGGTIANPIQVLCEIIAKLKDNQGKVAIPGFYDNVKDLEAWERIAFADLPWDEQAYIKELGVENTFGEKGYTTQERRVARPTLELNGIFGGYSGEGDKTVLPSWAGAKITCRLVPHQTWKEISQKFESYVKSITPNTVRITIDHHGGGNPVYIPRESKYVDLSIDAFEKGFGKKPVFMREGGSIPVVSTLKEMLGLDTMLLGFGRPDDNLHAPNEKFNLEDFHKGTQTAAWFMKLMENV